MSGVRAAETSADPGHGAAGRRAAGLRALAAARRLVRHPVLRHCCILLGYQALSILVTWPHARDLAVGAMPGQRDQALYTWDMWWVAHQVEHIASPFSTHQMFAPSGAALGYDTLMPLAGLIMMPVTAAAGPASSVNLLSVLLPGALCYVMYRAARLWLPRSGAFASGTFFGLSSMLTWRAWFHLNLAAGALFLPLALEASVRLRRRPSAGRAAALGLVIGLSLLVDQESALLAVMVVAAVLAGWLRRRPAGCTLLRTAALPSLAAAVALVVASPQVIAMMRQASSAAPNPATLAWGYLNYRAALPQMFTPSPRVSAVGLHWLGSLYSHGVNADGLPTFGVTLTALALLGAVAGWRNRRARTWLLAWLGGCVLALGPVLCTAGRACAPLPMHYHGQTMSMLLPYTWFVRVPGLSSFREANRFTMLALLPAALLAGSAVAWIGKRSAPVFLLVAALAVPELGWSAVGPEGTMPAGLPAADRAVAADHSGSLVVDVPQGFRSGTVWLGPGFPAEALVEATLDGHPRAIGYISRLPGSTVVALSRRVTARLSVVTPYPEAELASALPRG